MFHSPLFRNPLIQGCKQVNNPDFFFWDSVADVCGMETSINIIKPLKSVLFICKKSGRWIVFTICVQQAWNDATS